MIFFLIEAFERGSVETLEKRVGTDLGERIKCLIYDDLPLLPDFGPGTYIFGNFGLLSRAYQTCALELADALTDAGPGFRVLNHPHKVLDRFELLKKMAADGINDFQVYRAREWRACTLSFPVFVRDKDDHAGSRTDLIHDEITLEREISRLTRLGRNQMDNLIIVEFCDTSDACGFHRKYSAQRVGDNILTRCLNFSDGWITKQDDTGYRYSGTLEPHSERIEEEMQYMRNNPHENWLRRVFSIAGIEYGRVDYGVLDGRPQLWEINTAPAMGGMGNKKRSEAKLALRDRRTFTRTHFYERMGPALESIEPERAHADDPPVRIQIADSLKRKLLRERWYSRASASLKKGLERLGWYRLLGFARSIGRAPNGVSQECERTFAPRRERSHTARTPFASTL